MDQVYIRSRSPPAATAAHQTNRRQWDVTIRVNNLEETQATIIDPFTEGEYLTIFENYLRDSDRPKWSPHRLTTEAQNDEYEFPRAEEDIQAYAMALLDGLDLNASCFSSAATECQMYIIQHHRTESSRSATNTPDIHCLAWELLEQIEIPGLPNLRLRVTRISDFATPVHRPYRILQPLSTVQADTSKIFKILLVVARDFSRTGPERDPEPDLAQWPLMSVQKKLRSRLLLEVVRPGSVEELRVHLQSRERQGIRFNLVHFDLHGRITHDGQGNPKPKLLFAGHRNVGPVSGLQVPQTSLADANVVGKLLAEYKIENVVLNACLSAYNRDGPATNLSHILLQHGVRRVSAMWFYVHWQTVATYLETFYSELLVRCVDFDRAAHRGRAAIRQKPTSRTGQVYQDFFLCVNYASEVSQPTVGVGGSSPRMGTGPMPRRDPSPAPSIRSQDSSTSNTSIKSLKSGLWKPPTPRLGDGFFLTSVVGGDSEPVMRMKLHLLELEYKLLTSRIVYASDLRRADSKLGLDIDKLAGIWLATNLIDEVHYYRGKDFAKRRVLKESIPSKEKRTRASPGTAGANYLHGLLFQPRPVKALRPSLHIIRELDTVLDPGMQADEVLNQRSEERRLIAQENLQRFAGKILAEGADGHGQGSCILVLGSNDAQWWRTYLQHLGGEWWVHMPWGFTLHSRHRGSGAGGRRGLTMLGVPA
ncbi:hypothetical protein NLU13_1563 [Sarocladium strictum]|uniref:CHAT domain-containing protein n=1 Tax=Sarocladium strictum TaxID=5046 RepID=A0AA39GR76_SARSR|nr:hypothetical protein NLU13_1563 [Sarocladium strictum]